MSDVRIFRVIMADGAYIDWELKPPMPQIDVFLKLAAMFACFGSECKIEVLDVGVVKQCPK